MRNGLLAEAKAAVAASIGEEEVLIQASGMLDQLEQGLSRLVKKAREWYGLIDPEGERGRDQEAFLAAADPRATSAMGADLPGEDREALGALLESLQGLAAEREALTAYLERKMEAVAPNLALLAGPRLAAQLLVHAGSMERLASVPSGTLQLYGAEAALFRHLRNRRKHRAPKYGLLYNHPLVQQAREKGKAARALADKLSLCARIDRFGEERGSAAAQGFKEGLAARFGGW